MRALENRQLLVVEDEFLLADPLVRGLEAAGAWVIGPAPTEGRALALLEGTTPDAAILDIYLRGDRSHAVANALADRGIPFVFLSGQMARNVPSRFADVPFFEKPYDIRLLIPALAEICAAHSGTNA